MRRFLLFPALMALLVSSAGAYYHFLRYPSRLGPFTPIPAKFDLNALANKTVYFYISDQGPSLGPGDTYESLVSQVRQALGVWNGVATSDLRVGFGGVANLAASQAQAPGGEIVFDDLPPGVLGLCAPITLGPPAGGFAPIVRSRCTLPRDLTNRPTSSESFLNSLVHELGHGLGLQHTVTGSVMSQEPLRSTTRARPLAADDVAGISVLYPAPGFTVLNGSITGRVLTATGRAAHLASVVAINPGGAVVSGLTAPDGAYRIDGVPPGTYIVYAHSLPPSADIVLPLDDTGTSIAPTGPVETQFFGGAKDPNASFPVSVSAGASNDGIDFRLAERSSLPLYDVTTYSSPGPGLALILPAFLNISRGADSVIAIGQGTAGNLRNTRVGVLGGGLQVRGGSPAPYAPSPSYAQIDLEFSPVTGTGSRHLLFTLNNDVYVRPGAVQLVTRQAPLVREVQTETETGGALVLVLSGDNFAADSRVFLDGVAATVRSFDDVTGRLRVSPPSGASGRQAIISVYNSDGQSSIFVQPGSPVTYTYPTADAPSLTLTPSNGRAGRDVMVDIQATNTNFVDGQVVVGFGTPAVITRRVWVVSATHLIAVASISPRAALASTTVTVVSGLQLMTQAAGFRVDAAASSTTTPIVGFPGLINAFSGQPRVAPGALVSLFGVNLAFSTASATSATLPTTLAGTTVTINDRPAPLVLVSPTQINLQLPFGLPVGPAILRVSNGVETSAPMAVQIDAVAPGLFRAFNAVGAAVDANNPIRLGDTLVLYATGLGAVTPPATAGAPAPLATANSAVRVNIAGVDLTPSYAGLAPGTSGYYQVNVVLPSNLPIAASTQLFLAIEGQSSNALTIGLRAPLPLP